MCIALYKSPPPPAVESTIFLSMELIAGIGPTFHGLERISQKFVHLRDLC